MAASEASVIRQMGAVGCGYDKREALARASFVAVKAAIAESVQRRGCALVLPEERRE